MEVPEIDVDELARLQGARVIDVRQPGEYEEQHVPGAVLIPLNDVPDRVAEIASEGPVYVICKMGGRSLRASEFLRAQGTDAINVVGGTDAWVAAGHPVAVGDQPG